MAAMSPAVKAVESMRNMRIAQLDEAKLSALQAILERCMGVPYKEWAKLVDFAQEFRAVLGDSVEAVLKGLFGRVLEDGGWDTAAEAAASRPGDEKPWIVLSTGVNGIRKTTMMYQSWMQDVLLEALPDERDSVNKTYLPTGKNSFFRQLDFLIVTVANCELKELYALTDLEEYVKTKDKIFQTYRTLAEIWGILLVQEAMKKRLNVIIETTGKDDVMFKFVDLIFHDSSYRKLGLHASVNDVSIASMSVDTRMEKEIKAGTTALKEFEASADLSSKLISVNQGGTTYGLESLKKIEAASEELDKKFQAGDHALDKCWLFAGTSIFASKDPGAWTASAAKPSSKSYPFELVAAR